MTEFSYQLIMDTHTHTNNTFIIIDTFECYFDVMDVTVEEAGWLYDLFKTTICLSVN